MASHYKFYPASDEVVVPWNARYQFPSQANKCVKMTPRIPPKNGALFTPGSTIRLEFPAQGYINPAHTTLEFDVALAIPSAAGAGVGNAYCIRFQNNIQSIFSRVRLMYGSTPIEDIDRYNVIVRCLTEWTTGNPATTLDQSTINEGIGGVVFGGDYNQAFGLMNVRSSYIQGCSFTYNVSPASITGGAGVGIVPNTLSISGISTPAATTICTRRYQVQLMLGLFQQQKLIPTKFMASQLAIELTLEQPKACIYVAYSDTNTSSYQPTYWVGNMNLIPEILEFDPSYDASFLMGLQGGGVPIKFASWHTHQTSSGKASNLNFQINERSRSVKSIFVVQRRALADYTKDNGATHFDTSSTGGTLQQFQFRIGGRYFPSSPVQCSSSVGSSTSNGGAEAYLELQKALNIVGDYRLSTPCNVLRWAVQSDSGALNDSDFGTTIKVWGPSGNPQFRTEETNSNSFGTNMGAPCFAMSVNLETSNGVEISGLNAEEQADISLMAQWSLGQQTGSADLSTAFEAYVYYDAMIILRENNVLELVQ